MPSPVPTPPLSMSDLSARRGRQFSEATYSDEAVQSILRRALELRGHDRFSAQQLREMAIELDISPEVLSTAVAEWAAQSPAATAPSRRRSPASTSRRQQCRQYAFASILMVGIDIATTGTLTWSIFPVLGWGCALAMGKPGDRL